MDGIITLPCFALASFGHFLQTAFFAVGCAPLGVTLLAYIYWTFQDPDRLHDEEFQLRSREQLSSLEMKGQIISDPSELISVGPPTAMALSPGGAPK